MSRLEKATQALKRFVVLLQRHFAILEVVWALLAGALLGGTVGDKLSNRWLLAGAALSLATYLPLAYLKVKSQWILPATLFDNFGALSQLSAVEKELARKKSIDLFVDTSIKALNAQTCSIAGQSAKLCNETVKEGLMELLRALVDQAHRILDCETRHFSVGVLVTYTGLADLSIDDEVLKSLGDIPSGTSLEALLDLPWHQPVLVFRDDLEVTNDIEDNPRHQDDATGLSLAFKHSAERAINECSLDVRTVSIHGKAAQLICSPIPIACNEKESLGVIWFFSECLQELPPDLGNVLRIFGRIAGNWIFRYNQCIDQKLTSQLHRSRLQSSVQKTTDVPE